MADMSDLIGNMQNALREANTLINNKPSANEIKLREDIVNGLTNPTEPLSQPSSIKELEYAAISLTNTPSE